MAPVISQNYQDIENNYSSVVLLGYSPSPRECMNWELGSRYLFNEDEFNRVKRTIWNSPDYEDHRTFIDICETSSDQYTSAALEGVLFGTNVVMQDGPVDLGDVCKINPTNERNACYFTRANLCISVSCYGRADFDILSWAKNIDQDIVSFPESDFEGLMLSSIDDTISVGRTVEITYSLEWSLGEFGYYKFFAINGELSLNVNSLMFLPNKSAMPYSVTT